MTPPRRRPRLIAALAALGAGLTPLAAAAQAETPLQAPAATPSQTLGAAAEPVGAEPLGAQPAIPRNVIPWVRDALEGAPQSTQPIAPLPPAAIEPVAPLAAVPGTPPAQGAVAAPGPTPGPTPQTAAAARPPADPFATPAATPHPPAPSAYPAPGQSVETAAEPAPYDPFAPPAEPAPDPGTPSLVPADTGPTYGAAGGISVASLSEVPPAAAGVEAAAALGLPSSIWRNVTTAEAAQLLKPIKPTDLHGVNRFAVRLIGAAFEPPERLTNASGDVYFDARLAALKRFGAHRAIADIAETAGAALHPVAIDAALLSGRELGLCDAVFSADPSAPAPANAGLLRIYCLTLVDDAGGAGAGAMAAIGAARALGEPDETTLMLLEAAADPTLAEFVDTPSAPGDLIPIRMAAIRAAGKDLPPDYARATALTHLSAEGDGVSPRVRLEAMERLERSGALATEAMITEYAQSASAESGGVWGRVEAFRNALLSSPDDTVSAARFALDRAREGDREGLMARVLAPELARRAAIGAPMADAGLRRALRLGGQSAAAAALLSAGDRAGAGPEERALDRLAAPASGAAWDPSDLNPLLARAARGDQSAERLLAALSAFDVPIPGGALFTPPPTLEGERAAGRLGPLLLGALARLNDGTSISAADLYEALTMLRTAGAEDAARQIAVEAVLVGR